MSKHLPQLFGYCHNLKNKSHNFNVSFLTILLLLVYQLGSAQEKIKFEDVKDDKNYGRFRYVDVKGHTGSHMYSGETLGDAVSSGYGSFEVRYGWQPNDEGHWANKYYGSASYGVGFYSGYIGDPQIFGNPNALYGFADFVTSKPRVGRKTSWHIIPAIGLTYNLIPFDPETNVTNDAIGSKVAVYFNVGYGANTILTRELDLTYGIDFTHFSNGRSNTPNYGLNMFGLNLGMRYHYNADQRKIDTSPFTRDLLQVRYDRPQKQKNEKLHHNSFSIYTAVGSVENDQDDKAEGAPDEKFFTFSGVLDYRHRFSTMHAITVGVDLFYDESLSPTYPETSDRYLYGIHGGYDFIFYKFVIRAQIGTYLGEDGDKGKENLWSRFALQYNITDWFHAQVGLKTRRGFAADWVEFGVGFTPFKW